MDKKDWFLLGVFVFVFLVFLVAFFYLWQDKNKLESEIADLKIPIFKKVIQVIEPKNSFLVAENIENINLLNFDVVKNNLIANRESFIEANLEKMVLTLYASGTPVKTFPILAKGRKGSWWETPTGYYSILGKSLNLFSSIGKVWMPYSMQFYGNFFIHGWPYYSDGTLVPKSDSGGCIRLSTEDARQVFQFAQNKMPVLVLDHNTQLKNLEPLTIGENSVLNIDLSAESALIADLDTGEVILDKNSDTQYPIASLTKLMTAVVASELIYLDKTIQITAAMLSNDVQPYPLKVGKYYSAFDLLYPLFLESSNGSAKALASFLGEKFFVFQMNKKAQSLGMQNTIFTDSSGVSDENVSTLEDVAKLFKYILDKRRFIFDITIGNKSTIFGKGEFLNIENFNEFVGNKDLIGVKNGQSNQALQSLGTVWRFFDNQGNERHIFIGVLKSENRKKDVELLLNWIKEQKILKEENN